MTKPRRKHMGLNIWMESSLGNRFVAEVLQEIGPDLNYEALDETPDGKFIFYVEGGEGWGWMVEGPDTAETDCFITQVAFGSGVPDKHDMIHGADYTCVRWDAWLAAKVTGDRSLIDGSPSRRRRISAERRKPVAEQRDEFGFWYWRAEYARELLGVPVAHLETLKTRRDAALANRAAAAR